MRKLTSRLLTALLFVALSAQVWAQAPQLPPLPVDEGVKIGKLDNGLTYYIRHNETPKGQANFYIAQCVGSLQEEENQRGLAHFLEHMCFNGTENFKGNELIDWLETKGVKFGHDLNAHTAFDETIYKIPNVPTADKGVQDTCLIILHDWADGLLLDPEEIDKERGVIHEEWRRSMVGQMRLLEKLLPTVYPDSKYGVRLPIGTMEVVDNFTPQALRDYYETWYRPDHQAVIVVGDIDVDYIEGKIKEIFSPIKMPENPKKLIKEPVADNEGTIYALGADPEQTVAMLMFSFKSNPLIPDEYKNTQLYFPTNYIKSLVNMMFNNRFNDLNKNPDSKFAQASADLGQFFVSGNKDALSFNVVAKGNDITPGVEEAYREFLRVVKGGFTVGEYERARAEFLSRIDRMYDERNNTPNASYVQEYVDNFIRQEPIPGIEFEKDIYHQIAQAINVNQINQLLAALILEADGSVKQNNRVAIGLFPEGTAFVAPTQQQLENVLKSVEAENIEPYKDQMKSEPLIPEMPAPGKIVSEKNLPGYDATEFTLSNGMKVVVKPTKFKDNQIILQGVAKVGYGNVAPEKAADVKMLPYALYRKGLGNYTSSDLEKYLQGKQVGVNLSPSEYVTYISGSSTVKDLPTMMELLYMTFKDITVDAKEFESVKNLIKTSLENQEKDPQTIFSREVSKNMKKSPLAQIITVEDVDNCKLESCVDILHGLVANPADYALYFVGSIDMETFKPLMEQYIASLPADAAKAAKTAIKINPDLEPNSGKINAVSTTEMQTPQSWIMVGLTGTIPYTAKNRIAASAAQQILSNRLLKKIREEMGATYSIGASGGLSRVGDKNLSMAIPSPLKPELKDQCLKEIDIILNEMASNVTNDELNPIKEYMIKNVIKNNEENGEWASTMAAESINGVPTWLNAKADIESVTIQDVMNIIKTLLDQGNKAVVVLDPKE